MSCTRTALWLIEFRKKTKFDLWREKGSWSVVYIANISRIWNSLDRTIHCSVGIFSHNGVKVLRLEIYAWRWESIKRSAHSCLQWFICTWPWPGLWARHKYDQLINLRDGVWIDDVPVAGPSPWITIITSEKNASDPSSTENSPAMQADTIACILLLSINKYYSLYIYLDGK